MSGHWIAVASAEHVRRGREQGFMQICHGKGAPLRRVKPGNGIVYYSPSTTMGVNDRLQAFTALGTVCDHEPYLVEMDGGFNAYRRDVLWKDGIEVPIRPLLDSLEFTENKSAWGYQLRFGLCPISAHDFHLIEAMMSRASNPLENANVRATGLSAPSFSFA
jgi:hypothetical protein